MSFLGGYRRSRLGANVSEYGVGHRPNPNGPRINNLIETDLVPKDIYKHPEWYTAWPQEHSWLVKSLRGAQRVTVYRAGPTSELNNGDWVAITKSYAMGHRAGHPEYRVCAFEVDANDVRWDMNDLAEWGYWGPTVKAKSKDCSYGKKKR